jgi:hypothetical protein
MVSGTKIFVVGKISGAIQTFRVCMISGMYARNTEKCFNTNNTTKQTLSSETNSPSTSQGISRRVWNMNFTVFTKIPLGPVLSQMNPIHIDAVHFFND